MDCKYVYIINKEGVLVVIEVEWGDEKVYLYIFIRVIDDWFIEYRISYKLDNFLLKCFF